MTLRNWNVAHINYKLSAVRVKDPLIATIICIELNANRNIK
jgi:hypothetical protein